jgi:class 3 adenylate cyclase
VNLAARFETMTKTYGVPLIVGESTAAKLVQTKVVSLGKAQVQGRDDTVTVFTAAAFSNLVTKTVLMERDAGGAVDVSEEDRRKIEYFHAT